MTAVCTILKVPKSWKHSYLAYDLFIIPQVCCYTGVGSDLFSFKWNEYPASAKVECRRSGEAEWLKEWSVVVAAPVDMVAELSLRRWSV